MKGNASSVCGGSLSAGLRMVAFNPSLTLRSVTILVCILNGTICPAIIAANVMVFIAVLRKSQLRTIANTSILCLAFADLLVGLVVQPAYLVYQASKMENPQRFPCTELLVYSFTGASCICFSFLTLTLITLERYVAVFYPYRYTQLVTSRRIVITNSAMWLSWIVLIVALRFQYGVNSSHEITAFSFVIIANFMLTIFVYFRVFRLVRRCTAQVGAQIHQQNQTTDAQEAKASKTVALITGALFLCYTPTFCATVVDQTGRLSPELLYHVLYPLGETAVLFNSLLNPIIYVWRTEGIRRSLLEVLRIKCFRQGDTQLQRENIKREF